MEQWEGQAVHDSVCMVVFVRVNLHANREAVQAQVKVLADSTFDTNHPCDVLLAVVAMVKTSA